jgi:two-component system chemotaxis sensor kinase CheA
MSGFNLAELLPFYLDETDEHIAGLNDALLRLEQDPTDAKSLQEAFRMYHSIKGASVIMGFQPVNQLTHHLESLFDQLRSRKRVLDRTLLDLTFRCLDELRDYHRDLRAHGQSTVDLSGLIAQVVDYLHMTAAAHEPASATRPVERVVATPQPAHATQQKSDSSTPAQPQPAELPAAVVQLDVTGKRTLVVVFQPNLPLADMKARLVLNRLSSKARIVSTDPPVERLDEVESLSRFTIQLTTECGVEELHALADVEGVDAIDIQPAEPTRAAQSPAESAPEVTPVAAAAFSPEIATTAPPAQAISSADSPTAQDGQSSLLAPEGKLAPVDRSILAPSTASIGRGPAGSKSSGTTAKAKIAETIRVESDRLDHLMNLAGELVITKARFVAITKDLEDLFRGSSSHSLASDTRDHLESMTRGLEGLADIKSAAASNSLDRWSADVRRLRDNFRAIQDELNLIREARERLKALSEAIHSLGRVSDGLQKGVLDTRMVPIGPLFERFRRVIRDLSVSSGKEVALQINGEKTELDKRMIDELSDPLIHMVRNGVDHGLESPQEREAAGKPRAGTVSLVASHRGNSVVITVSDDGRGINCGKIREKIVAKGLASAAEARELSDRELIAFIWHPGMSTAETITEISGRGVGMDIVKSRIENLNGTVDVRSVGGQGTTFTIRLPLTLAIMSSLLVRIFDEVYAIPLDHIDEIVEVRPSQIYRVSARPAIEIRKKIIALVALGDVFRWGGKSHPGASVRICANSSNQGSCEDASDKRIVVVVQNGETTIGLLVDQLIGMQEVVLKSLEKNFRAIPGLSGASILGDGRVSLILDLDAVIDMVAHGLPGRSE